MILVLLGTQNNSFHRLLEEIERLIRNKIISEEVIVQAGYTKYESENMKILDFISNEELEELQKKADLIITHGGVGSIITSLEMGKKVIAVPRLHEYGEHVNNHQKEIVEKFDKNGNIIGIESVEELEEAIKKVKEFKPMSYTKNNSNMLEIIEKFIDDISPKTKKEERTSEKKKTNSILNRFFNSIGFPIMIGILVLFKTIFFYQNTISIHEIIDKDTVLGSIAFLATLICMICTLPNRGRIITAIIVDVFLSVLLFADNLYYTYSSSVLSVAQIMNLQYGEEIMDTLPMLIQAKQVFYVIDIITIVILLCTKILKIEKKPKIGSKKKIAKIIAGIISILLFFKIDITFIERVQEDVFNKDMQIKKSTIFGYHIADIENTINIKNKAEYKSKQELLTQYEELKEKYDEKYSDTNYDLQGVARGKNIIILQLESVQEFVINKEINGKQITPNLNQFLNENIEISNMFMQSYSSTADSEFSTVTSLYPMENGMSYSRYYTNHYDDIFTMFQENGYTTSYMHGNYGFFWNRGNVYKNFGVDNIEFKDNFEDTSEDIMGYLSDELLYRQAVEKLKNYDTPFVSFIVSASSHTSFSLEGLEDRSKVNIDVGKYQGTFFGNYLESVNYADYAFGVLIEELKKENLYDDTVILLFGDHNGIDMYNEEMIDFLQATNPNLTDTDIKLNYIRVACGMKIPGIEKIELEKPVNKLDIKPTFAYLINGDAGVSLGTNMFARKDFISLNNERMVTSRYYYDEKWFRRKDGEEINLEEISEDERELLEEYYNDMKKELDISISISINNLLK